MTEDEMVELTERIVEWCESPHDHVEVTAFARRLLGEAMGIDSVELLALLELDKLQYDEEEQAGTSGVQEDIYQV